MCNNLKSNGFYLSLFSKIDKTTLSEQDREIIKVYTKIINNDFNNYSANNFLNSNCIISKNDNEEWQFCGFENVQVKLYSREER